MKQPPLSIRFYRAVTIFCLSIFCLMSDVHAQSSDDCTEPADLVFTLWGSPFEKQAILDATDAFNANHPCHSGARAAYSKHSLRRENYDYARRRRAES